MEQLANNAESTLNGAINGSVTTLVVTSASSFPSVGNFRLVVDSEIMLVTAVSGTTFIVTRGVEGSTPAGHTSGVAVTSVLTIAGFQQFVQERTSQIGTRPAAGILGNLYFPNDGTLVSIDNGSSYDVFKFQTLFVPLSTSFTWINQKTGGQQAQSTDSTAGLCLYCPPDSADSWSFLTWATPGTPYSVVVRLRAFRANNGPSFGIGFRNSTTGIFKAIYFISDSGNFLDVSLGVGTLGAGGDPHITTNYVRFGIYDCYDWMKISDDGTNVTFYVSLNGIDWIQVYQNGRTTDMSGGPDELIIGANPRNASSPISLTVDSLKVF